ncbi:MAG: ABC transporter ATP-binding protein [Nitrososphaerota archaeon]|nr:ABC transporter ATP-binding protein [Aigarchaeota archaeon]MDW8076064.1 ABC transporter ATP-binding protein [Nitrososphaerota archaeon]
MLKIERLYVTVGERLVLKDVNLEIAEGEVHVLFGPNGSGKSSLVMTILGHPSYKVISGRIIFKGIDITEMPTEERIKLGIAATLQHPPKLQGIRLKDLLNRISDGRLRDDGLLRLIDRLKINDDLLNRHVNVGFSGGEIKKCELVQAFALNPDLLLFDEPDSGVDIENLELIGKAMSELLDRKSALIITHHGHILRYVKPAKAHVMFKGQIACEGDPEEVLNQISKNGYGWCERCISMKRS